MKQAVKVSVIIPVYNSEAYLKECLESVIHQTLQNIEIICVDDGSTDASMNILQEYVQKDERFKILEQRHLGGGAARNLGLKVAEGEYLSFLDSDDFFELDMLEKIYLRCSEKKADVGVFGVMCYHQATGAQNYEAAGLRKEYLPDKEVFMWSDFPEYVFNSFHNWAWNKLFLREFVLKNQIYFQEIKRTNDLLFTNKAMILASRIVILDEALAHYRIQIKDSCQSTNYLYSEDFFLAFQALMQFLKEYGIWDQVAMSYRNHALDGCIANLDSLEFRDEHERLYKHLKESIFRILEINLLAEEDVLKENVDKKERYNLIMSESYLTYVKNRADVYRLLFRNLQFSSYLQNVKLKEDNHKLEEELNHIKQSKTFILGKVLIHVPQKIYWFVKRYCK